MMSSNLEPWDFIYIETCLRPPSNTIECRAIAQNGTPVIVTNEEAEMIYEHIRVRLMVRLIELEKKQRGAI